VDLGRGCNYLDPDVGMTTGVNGQVSSFSCLFCLLDKISGLILVRVEQDGNVGNAIGNPS